MSRCSETASQISVVECEGSGSEYAREIVLKSLYRTLRCTVLPYSWCRRRRLATCSVRPSRHDRRTSESVTSTGKVVSCEIDFGFAVWDNTATVATVCQLVKMVRCRFAKALLQRREGSFPKTLDGGDADSCQHFFGAFADSPDPFDGKRGREIPECRLWVLRQSRLVYRGRWRSWRGTYSERHRWMRQVEFRSRCPAESSGQFLRKSRTAFRSRAHRGTLRPARAVRPAACIDEKSLESAERSPRNDPSEPAARSRAGSTARPLPSAEHYARRIFGLRSWPPKLRRDLRAIRPRRPACRQARG